MLMPCSPAHMNAQITASGKKNPSALPALIPAILTFGATPTMPIPLAAAAIVPAVCVPWPLLSFQAAGLVFGDAADARGALGEVDVRCEVRVGVVQPGVDVADDDGRAAAGDRVGRGRVDLGHVPLQARQAVGTRGGLGRRDRIATGGCSLQHPAGAQPHTRP